MANYTELKNAIKQVIRTNGNNEITGALLQQSLLSMINSLGTGYQFMGVATPSTDPGSPDQKVFYIATEPGEYPNFNGANIKSVGIFAWDNSWVINETGIPFSSLEVIYMQTNDYINYVGNTAQKFGGLFNGKIMFAYFYNSQPIGDVTFNISGTGVKPVYIFKTAERVERLSEKNFFGRYNFYYFYYDSGGDRYIVQDNFNASYDYPVTRFDMTPDGSGYYSAGGVITPFVTYRHKAFDITEYTGKCLRVRVGFGIDAYGRNFTKYSFVKLSDNTFITLESCEIDSPFQNNSCADVILPANAVELQCSWDTGVNALPNIPYIYYDPAYNYILKLYSLGVESTLEYDIKNIYRNFDMTPDGSGYYSAGGVITPLASYRHKAFDLSDYRGKTLHCKFGFPDYPAGWSWIKYEDNTYARFDSVGYKSGDEWVFVVPENIAELEASWDTGYTVPYMTFDADLQGQIDELREQINKPLFGKTIFLFGDSISSSDYTWYKDKLAELTGATVLNQGASGRNAAYQASNEYFTRLANNPNDIVVVLVGGNDSGDSGTIGTFDSNSPLADMGESVVSETDISVDYNGTKYIQAISHIIRKWKSIYWNFRLNAGLNANILDTQNNNTVVYPLSGTATESQCIEYAATQGWTLGYNQRYVMMTTETVESKRIKLMAVKQPKMFICTTLPQRRYNSASSWSNPTNWERKRLACIECAEKYGMPLIDLAKEFAIDWDLEPYWPGQGYEGTSMTDNQGIYTMDGLHPNEFGYEYISQIVAKHLVK